MPNIIVRFAAKSISSYMFRQILSILPITCAITFFTTLIAVYTTFTSEGLHPPLGIVCFDKISFQWDNPTKCRQMFQANRTNDHTFHNVTTIYNYCSTHLCDISVYGGWFDGNEHTIFRVGISFLSIQLLILLYGRLGVLQHVAPEELQRPCCCTGSVVTNSEACCSPSRCATVFGPCAVIFLIPMSFITFYQNGWHFGSAVITFVTLAIAEISDSIVQQRILQHAPAGGNCCCHLNLNGCLLNTYNFVMSTGGLLCFAGWIVTGATYFEWIAASLPFFYFIPFAYQTLSWYSKDDSSLENGVQFHDLAIKIAEEEEEEVEAEEKK